MFGLFGSRKKFKGDGYSVELQRGTRECVNAVYREGQRLLDFGGEFVGKKWEQVNLSAPQNLTPEDTPRVLRNLGAALAGMRYEYVITKTHLEEPYSEEERQAAIAELRLMGFAADVLANRSVKLTRAPGATAPKPAEVQAEGIRVMRLARTASGKRTRHEVLGKSGGAVVDFILT